MASLMIDLDHIQALAKRREEVRQELDSLDAEIRSLAQAKDIPAIELAKALGISRQRIYQLAE